MYVVKQEADESMVDKIGVTGIIAIINALIYLIMSILTIIETGNFIQISEMLLYEYGLLNYAVIYHYQYWRLISAIFIHADIAHFGLNTIFLLIYGYRLEDAYSKKEWFIVYFASGIAGNIISVLILPENSVSIGASGAIFGLLGALLYLVMKYSRKNWSWLVGMAFFYFVFSIGPNTNIFAHFMGLVAGIFIAWYFEKRRKIEYLSTY